MYRDILYTPPLLRDFRRGGARQLALGAVLQRALDELKAIVDNSLEKGYTVVAGLPM